MIAMEQLFIDMELALDGYTRKDYNGIQEYYINLEKDNIRKAYNLLSSLENQTDESFETWYQENYGG